LTAAVAGLAAADAALIALAAAVKPNVVKRHLLPVIIFMAGTSCSPIARDGRWRHRRPLNVLDKIVRASGIGGDCL
jgi:hypothetical protein